MFKSILNWLVSTEPISRWILIIMLLGMIADVGFILKHCGSKMPEKEL